MNEFAVKLFLQHCIETPTGGNIGLLSLVSFIRIKSRQACDTPMNAFHHCTRTGRQIPIYLCSTDTRASHIYVLAFYRSPWHRITSSVTSQIAVTSLNQYDSGGGGGGGGRRRRAAVASRRVRSRDGSVLTVGRRNRDRSVILVAVVVVVIRWL